MYERIDIDLISGVIQICHNITEFLMCKMDEWYEHKLCGDSYTAALNLNEDWYTECHITNLTNVREKVVNIMANARWYKSIEF